MTSEKLIASETRFDSKNNVGCLVGPIRFGMWLEDFSEFLSRNKGTKFLVVRSLGGSVTTAMDVAEQIYRAKNLDVVVDGFCMSSCANYIFLLARYKFVNDNSVVLWHGGPVDLSEETVRSYAERGVQFHTEKMKQDALRSDELLARRGINKSIIYEPLIGEMMRRNPDGTQCSNSGWVVGPNKLRKVYNVKGIVYMWYDSKRIADMMRNNNFCIAPIPLDD